jgi:phosphoribosylformylglycinamidine synthase
MLEIPGAPALSAFRIAKLLDRLATIEPGVRTLTARFVHFADLERALDAAAAAVLRQLLTYGPRLPEDAGGAGGERVLIVPRAGTISPW